MDMAPEGQAQKAQKTAVDLDIRPVLIPEEGARALKIDAKKALSILMDIGISVGKPVFTESESTLENLIRREAKHPEDLTEVRSWVRKDGTEIISMKFEIPK